MMINTKTTIAIIGIIAASSLAILIHINDVYANHAADPPQQPTGHFEDPAAPSALQHAKDIASPNSLPLFCGTLHAGDPVPDGCINDVPEDFPPSLLPPK
jgi:hypothetical protein